MRALLDTDVILDLLLEREPFVRAAIELFDLNEQGRFDGYISGITPVNVFYIARKLIGRDKARRVIDDLLRLVHVCPITGSVLNSALALPFTDYEDAVQHASAMTSGLDAIITRNLEDYKNATLPVFSPTDFLHQLTPLK